MASHHIVMFSGGAGSWMAAKRVAERYGTDGLVMLFADTMMEDGDLYRFLIDASRNVGGELVQVADGRTPWEVFFDVSFLGNTRIDPCSRILKRELLRKWVEKNCDPSDTVVYLGYDWTEEHRFQAAKPHWEPWVLEAPLCDEPYLTKADIVIRLDNEGIKRPRLYGLGFPHNNCGGFCVKAGQAHFKLLLDVMPERYAYHERKEQELREHLGKDVSILRDRRGGPVRPLTLREFRENLEAGGQCDMFEWGGCGCFSG